MNSDLNPTATAPAPSALPSSPSPAAAPVSSGPKPAASTPAPMPAVAATQTKQRKKGSFAKKPVTL